MHGTRLLRATLALLVTVSVFTMARAAVVTNTNDSGPGSLRQAIANATLVDPVITFDTALSGQSLLLTSGELVIDNGFFIYIDATGLTDGLAIGTNNASRIFRIGGFGNAVISGLDLSGGASGYGGAIRNNGTLILIESTITGSQATLQGGGIYNDFGTLQLRNVTLDANSTGGSGGGLYNQNGSVTLYNTTLTGNTAVSFGGGIANDAGSLSIGDSLVAGNSGPAAGSGADIGNRNGGTITPTGANLIGNNDSVGVQFPAGPLVGTAASPLDPLLAPLGDYGGPTTTRLPLSGSLAIDAATAAIATTDQRGLPRPFGPASDLGSVEVTDSDGDGLDNGYESAVIGTDPNLVDSDSDGLVDGAGGVIALSAYPGGIDADGDGFVDGEQDLGTDPAVSNVGDVAPRGSPDNLIGLGDFLVLTRLATGGITPSALESALGDINGDTRLDTADLLLLLPLVMN